MRENVCVYEGVCVLNRWSESVFESERDSGPKKIHMFSYFNYLLFSYFYFFFSLSLLGFAYYSHRFQL